MAEPGQGQEFEERGVAFFGRMAAAVSHEFNNVLTIIDQVTGLLGDLADMSAQGNPINPAMLKQQVERLTTQVQRGTAMSKELNRFAHSVDQQRAEVDLSGLARNTAALMASVARRRRTRIEVDPPADAPSVTTQAFVLREVLAALIDAGLPEKAPDEDGPAIRITARADGEGAALVVSAPAFRYDLEGSDPAARASTIGARLERGETGDGLASWAIVLPRAS